MPLYIKVNGKEPNPLVQIACGILVLAVAAGIFVLLLPVLGFIALLLAVVAAAIVLYGLYIRWRYGSVPAYLASRMQRDVEQAQAAAQAQEREQTFGDVGPNRARTGVKRTTIISDAQVVEEIRRRPPTDD